MNTTQPSESYVHMMRFRLRDLLIPERLRVKIRTESFYEVIDKYFDKLVLQYSASGRHHHTLMHIGETMDEFNVLTRGVLSSEEIELGHLAIFWHDAKYSKTPRSDMEQSDEAASAYQYARDVSEIWSVMEHCVAEHRHLILWPYNIPYVKHGIRATEHGRVIPRNRMEAFIADADLSVLGSGSDRFLRFENDIWKEFEHVPRLIYLAFRIRILRRLFEGANGQIFWTMQARERLLQQALKNLNGAINRYENELREVGDLEYSGIVQLFEGPRRFGPNEEIDLLVLADADESSLLAEKLHALIHARKVR